MAEDIDVQQVMERIRENIRRRRSLESGATSEPLAPASGNGRAAPDFAHLQSAGDLRKIAFTSHRPLVGSLVVAVKTVLLKLLTPLIERQAAYNAASARATADLGQWLQTLERRQAHATDAMQTVTEPIREHLSALERSRGQLHAEVAFLRTEVTREIARLRDELIARVSEHTAARDAAVHQEVLGITAELRQQLAAQSRVGEAVQERVSASERRWRRVLHVLQPHGAADSRAEAPPVAATPPAASELEPDFDYAGFEERFRGREEDIKGRQRVYVPYFEGADHVLDLGCGRGEFLELLREAGMSGRGVDLDLDMVLLCREKELDVVRADVFAHLAGRPDESVGGIFAAQLVEHLEPRRVIELVKLCHRKLTPGGCLVLETPNPQCLMVFADSFYRDLSHIKPIHPDTLKFVLEAGHFDAVEVKALAPVDASLRIPLLRAEDPALKPFNEGLERLNTLLFGFQDYAAIGRKRGGAARQPRTAAPGHQS